MDSRVEWLLGALLNGESIDNFEPRSRLEQYLEAVIEKSGTDNLEIPRSRLDALLYEMADRAPDNHASAVEAGKTQEWSDFWDVFQKYGERKEYGYAFKGFDNNIFKPKYNLKPTSAPGMFQSAVITNLKQLLKDRGVVLDLSACTNMAEMFSGASVTHVPAINTRQAAGITSVFYNASALVEIEKLILRENGTQTINSTFNNASSLENIVIEGTIGANIQLQWSTKLTHDSLMSVINHLKDYSADTSGTIHLLKIGTTNIAKLTDSELEIIISKGWTYE